MKKEIFTQRHRLRSWTEMMQKVMQRDFICQAHSVSVSDSKQASQARLIVPGVIMQLMASAWTASPRRSEQLFFTLNIINVAVSSSQTPMLHFLSARYLHRCLPTTWISLHFCLHSTKASAFLHRSSNWEISKLCFWFLFRCAFFFILIGLSSKVEKKHLGGPRGPTQPFFPSRHK